ncbi:MAG: TldD/PmbA family protein [Acidimicrobiia bacterium]|nr:TldD/PmbA family protein [Acidimicrobiia bacterium]
MVSNEQLSVGTDLLEAADRALEHASAGMQTEVVVLGQHLALTRYSSERIHQSVSDVWNRVWVRSCAEGGAGWASTADLSGSGLMAAVGEAEANARLRGGDRIDLASEPPAFEASPYFEATANTDAARRAELAAQHAAQAGATGINGNLRVAVQELLIRNSAGLRASLPMTYIALNVVTRDQGGATWYETAIGRDVEALDLSGTVERALAGVGLAAEPVAIEPGEYRVILDPPAVSMLLTTMGYVGLNAFGASVASDDSSYIGSHLGSSIASSAFSLRDDPTDPAALFTPFDAEGTARRPLDIIVDGVAAGFAHDRTSAAAAGVSSTGHALPASMKTPSPLSLSVSPGTATREELVQALGDGLIVHRIHPFVSLRGGPKADLSGTTRDGVLVVRGGEVVGAATNVRWSNTMTDLFGSVEAASSERSVQWMDLPDHSPITSNVPSLLCGAFTVHASQPLV